MKCRGDAAAVPLARLSKMKPTRISNPPILVVDDQADVRAALRLLLKSAGHSVVCADSPEEALSALDSCDVAAALVDMNYRSDTTSGSEGLALIERMASIHPDVPVIAVTAWSSVDLAVEAMQRGAVDFIEKPWNNTRVLNVINSQIELAEKGRAIETLSAAQSLSFPPAEHLIATSTSMRSMLADLAKIAKSDASILLLGESGSGKSHVAKCIHSWSNRNNHAFVTVDLGSLSGSLFESEMFGHVRGAFTDAKQHRTGRFELASGGTLFLDEIGNLPPDQQPKLLRALETGEFERVGASRSSHADVRTISATNIDIVSEVEKGRFRQDLLYRLNMFVATMPPLRERREDIIPLARYYLSLAESRHHRNTMRLTSSAEQAVLQYSWPGNVRELSHVLERATLLADTRAINASDLRLSAPEPRSISRISGDCTLEQVEVQMLRNAIQASRGSLQRAADQLGITRQSLYRRLEKHGIEI